MKKSQELRDAEARVDELRNAEYREQMGDHVSLLIKIFQFTTPTASGCWQWNGKYNNAGYPVVHVPGIGKSLVHRVICIITHDMDVSHMARHRCANKRCVNPAHLVPGSRSENATDFWRGRGKNAKSS